MFLRSFFTLALLSLIWFNASPALAATSTAQLYIDHQGQLIKIGAARCEALTAGKASAIGIVGMFRTINRPAPNLPRIDTGLSFDIQKPATMLISHRGLVSSVFADVKSPQEQTVRTVIPARGVPPFDVTVGGFIPTKQYGFNHYRDGNGNLDIELTCGNRSSDSLPVSVQRYFKQAVDEIWRGTIVGINTLGALTSGLASGFAVVILAFLAAIGNALQQFI